MAELVPAPSERRKIPALGRLLSESWCHRLIQRHGREWVLGRIREALSEVRAGARRLPEDAEARARLLTKLVEERAGRSLRPVINATGVILHTNLGRAPLAASAKEAMLELSGYGNVEFDLRSGSRGSRYRHCASLLAELAGADDALVVNNCAAALSLALAALSGGRGVAVSHGELVEIGGGFRVPEIVRAAGARIVAVGTTNRTRLRDYEAALDQGAAALLKVHRSNFRISGFAEDVEAAQLARLAEARSVPFIYDIGSGLFMDAAALGFPEEPTAQSAVAAGADLVAFSTDKLMGGPQGGVLAGKKDTLERARRHPLCRAFRVDKTTLAALEATLRLYRNPTRALAEVPVLRMARIPASEIGARAKAVVRAAPELHAEIAPGRSLLGGGTMPGASIATRVIRLPLGEDAARGLARLRVGDPPIIARGREGRVVLDLRTVAPKDDSVVASGLRRLAEWRKPAG